MSAGRAPSLVAALAKRPHDDLRRELAKRQRAALAKKNASPAEVGAPPRDTWLTPADIEATVAQIVDGDVDSEREHDHLLVVIERNLPDPPRPSPTVYEGLAITNDSMWLTHPEVQRWAYEALAELGRGGHRIAGTMLAELTMSGYPGADAALAGVAAGHWAEAIDLLRPLARPEVRASRASPVR